MFSISQCWMLFVSVENCPEYLLFIFEGTQWCRTNTIISNFCKIQVMEKWGNSFRNVPWNLRFTEIFYTLLLLQRSACNYNISYTDPRWDVCVSFVEIFVKCLPSVRILLLLQSVTDWRILMKWRHLTHLTSSLTLTELSLHIITNRIPTQQLGWLLISKPFINLLY